MGVDAGVGVVDGEHDGAFGQVTLPVQECEQPAQTDDLESFRLEQVELGESPPTFGDVLEDLDDVQEVYSNADISDDVLAQL
mgnify:CR=1 FL=1